MKVSKEQIAAWKKKYGSVFRIRVEDKEAYLRPPTRRDISYATTAGQSDPIAFNEMILKNCWLGGDEEIMNDDAYFLAASSQLDKLIEIKTATLEKL